MKNNDIGIFGFGAMGRSLALNFERNGFKVSAFNRKNPDETIIINRFISENCQHLAIDYFDNINSFLDSLLSPKKILLMVKSGPLVDKILEEILPKLKANDIIIDGGNSNYKDTDRRVKKVNKFQIMYIGCGISGGIKGALNGASIMPGGNKKAWVYVSHMFESISAKNNNNPSCRWIGNGGAGHYVKMVHNGIEYAMMQILAEAYDVQKRMLSMSNEDIKVLMESWNKTNLSSYLLEITCNILSIKDKDDKAILDKILDYSTQKGTGKDAVFSAIDLESPCSTLFSAIESRYLSNSPSSRNNFSSIYKNNKNNKINMQESKSYFLSDLYDAVYVSQLIAYMQGFLLLKQASLEYNWKIDLNNIVKVWRSGCIIQSKMVEKFCSITEDYGDFDLFLHSEIIKTIKGKELSWRRCCANSIQYGIPVPAISSSISFFDTMSSEQLPSNLIQAQRDFFGFHGFYKVDDPTGRVYHLEAI